VRNAIVVVITTVLVAACASERGITSPTFAPELTTSRVQVQRIANRCPHDGAPGAEPYYVVDGRIFAPGSVSSLDWLDPASIEAITIVKGDEAASRYGSRAGVAGVVVIVTRRGRGAGTRPAS
jgi:hypothetical protein